MTSGFISIRIPDGSLEGTFVDGVLVKGTITNNNTVLTGTFNTNHQLHGDDCEKITPYNKKVGTFYNGEFLKGVYTDNEITLSGEFKFGMLQTGIRTTRYAIYEGVFSSGHLTNGSITFKNANGDISEIHKGKFYKGKLYDGSIISENYRAEFMFTGKTLNRCEVYYNGELNRLNKVQFILLCCNGSQCDAAYTFYQNNLLDYSIKQVLSFNYASNGIYKYIMQNIERRPMSDICSPMEDGPIDIFDYYTYDSHA